MKLWLLAALGLVACATPCTDLNARMTEVYDVCEVTLPADLEDGGRGRCSVDDVVADCEAGCYEDADCAALDGTDPDAEQALTDCVAACG